MSTSNSKNGRTGLGSKTFFRKVGAFLASTALLASTNLTTAALANEQGGRGAAFEQFQLNNPGLDNKELKQMFNQEWKGQQQNNNNVQDVINNIQGTQNVIQNNNNIQQHISRNDFASKAEFQAAKQALQQQNKNLNDTINQTIQQTANNQIINVNQGFALDLGSAVESITLGDKLFKHQESVTINVGGQDKTFGAGSKVTAAEYVAAKQALNTGSQTVALDASGRATGGVVDLDAMTNGNKTMKVTDLVVPVDVVASGDFGKGGDVRINGNLVNSGSIVANGGKVTAWIGADNITNNAGASINSNVDHLVLDADNAFANYGDISAKGNLTIAGGSSVTNTGNVSVRDNLNVYSPNVTNSGNLASTKGDVTFDAIASNMNINNSNGTVSALNGAINIREAAYNESFNSAITGGDLLSQELNVNTGGGTADVFVNQLTGTVNSSGTAAHVSANTADLTIGKQCLVGDPTYFNTGNIILNGDIVVGEALAIIAGGNITATSNLGQITARDLAGQGYNINIIAGANITAGTGQVPPDGGPATLPGQTTTPPNITGNATSSVTFTGADTDGGNLDLSGANAALTINSSSTTTGLNGGNLTLVAYEANGTGGVLTLPSTSTLNAGGGTGAVNGGILVGSGNSISIGNVNSVGGSTAGVIDIRNFNPEFSSGASITFDTTGNITSGNTIVPGAFGAAVDGGLGDVVIGDIASSGTLVAPIDRHTIASARNLTTGNIFSTIAANIGGGLTQVGIVGAYDVTIQGDVTIDLGISIGTSRDLTAGNLTTTNGFIVVSAGNFNNFGDLNLGDVTQGGTAFFHTAQLIATGSASIGDVFANAAVTLSANGTNANTSGLFQVGDVTSTTSTVSINSLMDVQTGSIAAQGAISIDNTVDQIANPATVASTITIGGLNSVTANVSILSTGDVAISGNTIAETDILIRTDVTGFTGTVNANDLTSNTGTINVNAFNTILVGDATGALGVGYRNDFGAVTAGITAGTITTTAASSGTTVRSFGAILLGDISTQGNVVIGDNVAPVSTSVGTGSITTAEAGSSVYIRADGLIATGNISTHANAIFDNDGGVINSGVQTGDVTTLDAGSFVQVLTTGAINMGNINTDQGIGFDNTASTNGSGIQTGDITVRVLNASGIVTLTSDGAINTGDISAYQQVTINNTTSTSASSVSTGDIDTNVTAGGSVAVNSLGSITVGDVTTDTSVSLNNTTSTTNSFITGGNLAGDAISVQSKGAISLGSAIATIGVNINNNLVGGAGDIDVTGGVVTNFANVTIGSFGHISTGDLTAGVSSVFVNNSGSNDAAAYVTTGQVNALNNAQILSCGAISTGSVTANFASFDSTFLSGSNSGISTGNFTAQTINLNATGDISLGIVNCSGFDAINNTGSFVNDFFATSISANNVFITASGNIDASGLVDGAVLIDMFTSQGSIGNAGTLQISTPSLTARATVGFVDLSTTRAGTTTIFGNNGAGLQSWSLVATDVTSYIDMQGTFIPAPINTGTITLQARTGVNVNGVMDADFINLNTSTGGVITLTNNAQLLSSTGTAFRSDSVDINASAVINAGSGFVSFAPITDGTSIGVAGATGTLNLTTAELDTITADAVVIGDRNLNGGILVQDLDTSGANVKDYDLIFNNRGDFSSVGFYINTGFNDLTIDVGGNIAVGAITGGDVILTAPFGTVTINGVIVANNSLSISVFGDITNAMFGGFLNAPSAVNLASTIGTIGTQLQPLLVSTAAISAIAPNGSVFINNLSNAPTVTIGDITGDTIQIVRTNAGVTGGMLVTGVVGGNDITLRNTAASGGVDLAVGGFIGGIGGGRADTVTLIGKGAGSVTSATGTIIDTLVLTATTDSGVIDITDTTAHSITTGTTGNLSISDSSTIPVTINSANGAVVNIALTTPGAGLVIASPITGTTSIALSTVGNGNITRTGANTVLNTPILTITSGGDIGSSTAAILTDADTLTATAGAGKNIFISESNSVALGNITGNTVSIAAVGSISRSAASTITANSLNLSSALGDIGATGAGTMTTTAGNISATAFGDVWLTTNFAGTAQIGALSGQVVDLRNTVGKIRLLQDVTGSTSVSISTTGAGVNAISQVAGKTILTPSLTLLAANGGAIGSSTAAIKTTAGDINAQGSDQVFLNATGDVNLINSSGTTLRLTSGGGIVVLGNLYSDNLTLTTTANGNIDLQGDIASFAGLTSSNTVVMNANGSGDITNAGAFVINTNSLSLTSGSGDIGTSLSPILVSNSGSPFALAVNTTGDWFVTAQGGSLVNFGASTGASGSLIAAGGVNTTGNTTLTGTLDIETDSLNVQNDKLAADIINIHAFPGNNLNIDGGAAGGIFASTTQTNWTASGGGSIFLSGKMTMNGSTFINSTSAGQVTINGGASYIGNNLVKITSGVVNQIGFISGNPLVYDLLGNTILNTNGDVNLASDIIFVGENFAILASGNINFSAATTIRLANGAGDAGNLTLVAGYNITPATVGQIRSTVPYTLGTASTTGGSINMGGTTIDLSGSNNGGSLTAVAQGQAGGNAGTVALGSINTTGANIGGGVRVIGSGGVSVGAVNTTGGTASGNVALEVMNSQIVGGSVVLTNGTRSGSGQFVGNGATAGDLSYGGITATGAQVFLTGALNSPTDVINGTGTIVADTLTLQTGTGVANVGNTQINTLNTNGNGTVSLSNSGALILDSVGGNGQNLTATATGAITNTTGFNINTINLTGTAASGNTAINLIGGAIATTSANLKSLGGGNILGGVSTNDLTINSTGNVGVNAGTRFTTDAATVKVDAAGSAFLNDTALPGVAFSSGTVANTLDILATGTVTGGTITTSTLRITANFIGTGTGANALSITNGASLIALEVHTNGNSFIKDNGTGVLQIIGGSSGQGFSLETATGASVFVTGDITFGGDINITTNSMTNFFDVATTGGNINIQSNAGSNLQLFGAVGPTPATYSAAGAINMTTNGTVLDISGNTTYLTTANLLANVAGQSVFLQAGSISTATIASFIYTANVNGTGSLVGPWNVVNSGTYANNGGNVTLGSITFNGADIAIIASGDINLGTATINLSGNNGGNLTMLAGFNFDPNTFGQINQDTATTFQNFSATSSGSILGTATINLDGAAGNGGRMIALANNGSVSLGNISSTGTVGGGGVTIIASNGITTGSINTTGPFSGAVNLIVGNPTVGSGTNFQILAGSIITGANTVSNLGLNNGTISVGNISTGNNSFTAQTGTTGSIVVGNGLSARNINLTTGVLNLTTINTLSANTDASGNGGTIDITANNILNPSGHLAFSAVGTGAGAGGSVDLTLNSAAAVTLGTADRFDFQFSGGTGNAGFARFTSLGDVTLAAGAFTGVGGTDGGAALVDTVGNITVNNANAFSLVGADGKGAAITLNAGTDGTGVLALGANTGFFTQANGTGSNGDGGSLTLTGQNITYTGVGTSFATPLALTAKGVGNGDGGTIIYKTADTTATFMGNPGTAPKAPVHFISADATAGTGTGNGGSIDIETGGNLTALQGANSLDASPGLVGNGNGGNYTLKAGSNGAIGTLILKTALNADGRNAGFGGSITLSSRSTTAFSINRPSPKNGSLALSANGNFGSINVSNLAGGILVNDSAAVSAQEMHFSVAGSKGAFTAGAGAVITAANELTIQAAGGSIGGKTLIGVNTALLTVNTSGAGLVGINNLNAGASTLLDSSSGGGFTFRTSGSTTVNDIVTVKGSISIVETAGALSVANGAFISATNGALIMQNTDAAGTIAIGDNATVRTFGNQGKSVSIVIGATVPTTGTNPFPPAPAGVNVAISNPKNFVWFGGNNAVSVPTGTAQVTSKNQNVLFSGLAAATITLGNGSLVLADPPDRVSTPSVAAAVPVVDTKSSAANLSQIFGFAGEQTTVTSDLSVLNLNAAPQMQAANNATLMTASNSVIRSGALHAPSNSALYAPSNSTSNSTSNSGAVSSTDDDNSYMVGYMGSAGETEAAICSDVEIVSGHVAAATRVQNIQHSERVVIKKGNVLFVPFKDTTVETPNGIVHISAKSIALVSSNENGLAVYDLEDQHKGSVSVESNGHNVVLSPGRHVMITRHHGAEFAQINQVETIAHRNVQSAVKNGHRAHTSEFSVLTAMDTVKPLKAMVASKNAQAKQIADRMLKTTAIILQIGGAAGQYQHYFKPRMTAMQ